MKKARKGFTLVELLIVITIIAMLGTLMLVSGTDAQNAAKAVKINESFRNLTAAVLMYNEAKPKEVAQAIADEDADTTLIPELKKYLKNDEVFDSAENTTAGTYYIVFKGSTLWLTYYLLAATGAINNLLKDKAKDYGLKKAANANPKATDNDYAGGQTIYVNVL